MGRTAFAWVCFGISLTARADFVVPDGSNLPWIRGSSSNSAYAQWEAFSSPGGPNVPDVGSYTGGVLAPGAPAWDAFDSSGQSFITSGGNIYSFSAPLNMHVVVPSFGRGVGFRTTVLLQVRTQGNEVLPSSLSIGGVAPAESRELSRESLGGMGFLVDTLYRWDLPGNAASYEVRFDASDASMSMDRIAVDTFASPNAPTCYANCDGSTVAPALNVNDFVCFLTKYAAGESYANCDGSSVQPVLNVNDFVCFQTRFAQGCP